MSTDEEKAKEVKDEAAKIAVELIAHAKETARQMMLNTNLDTSKIPLICNKIVKIQSDMAWMKWLLTGLVAGVGYVVVQLLVHGLK